MTLAYLDECGFSPSLPVCYSWTLRGERKLVPYENPMRRRANAISAYLPFGRQSDGRQAVGGQVENNEFRRPELCWDVLPRTLKAEDVVDMLRRIPRGKGALVVVLDNASIHVSRLLKAARRRLHRQGIHLYHLPPYSPELNLIEPYFGIVKHTEMPERTYSTLSALIEAIDQAFTRCEHRLHHQPQHQLRLVA